jgi:hypothetical protein
MNSASKTTTKNDLPAQLQQIGLRALPQNLDDFLARASKARWSSHMLLEEHNGEDAKPMVCGIQEARIDQGEKQQCRKNRETAVHQLSGDLKADPAQCYSEQQYRSINNPDARSESLEDGEVDQVRTRGSKLEKIEVRKFTIQHPLPIHPKKELVTTEQNWGSWHNKQIQI